MPIQSYVQKFMEGGGLQYENLLKIATSQSRGTHPLYTLQKIDSP